MRTFTVILFVFATTCFFVSCASPPNTKAISQDLGITLPRKYKLINADSDPFGLGADANITYVFKFDSLSYVELIKSIEGSILYSTAAEKDFDTLSVAKKRSIIETLAKSKMTSYWIKSDSDYVFDGLALIINEPKLVYKQVFDDGVDLPNLEMNDTDGTPVLVYTVKAKVDRKKRILYYNYVHI